MSKPVGSGWDIGFRESPNLGRRPRRNPAQPSQDACAGALAYSATFAAGPTTLTIPHHEGGDVDWYSATATGPAPPRASPPVVRTSYPTRVSYDGSPHPRWWQIENHRYDPGAVALHRTQLAAMPLGRRTDGRPVLWIQRRRSPLLAPPASTLRLDILEEVLGVDD